MKRKIFNDLKFLAASSLGAYTTFWLLLETSSYFGWIDLQNTGFKTQVYFILISIILGGCITYLHFRVTKNEVRKGIDEMKIQQFPQLLDFQETFKKINWTQLVEESSYSIDIIVYYFDSWVNQNEESLVKYLSKPRTKIRVFVANPNDENMLENIARLFPEYSKEIVKEKVAHTKERFLDVLKKVGASSDRFEFYYYPHFLNYSIQVFDSKKVVLSIFEMYRNKKIDSPAFLIDLEKSRHLKEFMTKEIDGILSESSRVA